MKQPSSPPEASTLVGSLRALVCGVREFWFAPGDPTTLGFIRICTGLTLLYVLVVSGPMLSSFYGPDAWIDAEASDALRKDYPWQWPESGWDVEGAPPWFLDMDRDGDGVVTRAEWTGAAADEFGMIDSDRDGRITLEEANRHGRFIVVRPEVRSGGPEKRAAADRAWQRWGVDPARSNDSGQPFFSHFFHLKTPAERTVAHLLGLLVVVLFTLGVGTRVTSVLAWVVGLCYVHRLAAVAVFGMDTMMGIALLYLMIGPCGAALSVDRLVTNWLRRRAGLPEAEAEKSVLATTATRLLQVHFCLMYLVAGTTKLQGPAWWNGTATWQTLTNYEFMPRGEAYTELLRLLSINRWVWELFNVGGAWATVGLEIGFPFLIWKRKLRWLLICASVCMHLFIGVTMGLTAFSTFMICILFAFVPPETLKAAMAWAREKLGRLTQRQEAAPIEEAGEVARV